MLELWKFIAVLFRRDVQLQIYSLLELQNKNIEGIITLFMQQLSAAVYDY